MKLINKYKWQIALVIILVCLFLVSRLYNLLLIPLFTDEAIYIRWSQIARLDASWRFISLTDGKQPLFIWLTMVAMKFISDPLLAGRLVSVGAGLATMVGLILLTRELFKNLWCGFLTALVYIIFPMALIYDRMALYDSLVGTFTVWSIYLSVLLVKRLRFDLSLLLGIVLGGGLLTKSSSVFSIYLMPFNLILFNFRQNKRWLKFFTWVGLTAVAVIMAYSYQSILRLSPFFHIIGEKNNVFIYSLKEWQTHPFRFFYGNFLGLWDWFLTYLTWPLISLMALSFLAFLKFTKEKILLFFWFIIPFTSLALFGKVLYPRFILFMILPLLPLVALALFRIYELVKNKFLFFALCLILFFWVLRSDFLILTDPAIAPVPRSDLEQYLNGWPAGGGVNDVISFLSKEAEKQKIFVASEGTFGSLPTFAVEIYLGENKNIDKEGIWPVPSTIPVDLLEKAKVMPVYFIINQEQNPPSGWPLKLIARYQKGRGNSYINLYQVSPQKE